MRLVLLCVMLLIIGCGKNDVKITSPEINYSVDPELESYVEEFYQKAEELGISVHTNIQMSFKSGDLRPEQAGYQVGLCTRYPTGGIIFISREFFDGTIETRRRSLILHELGHCVLNRNHRSSTMTIPYAMGVDIFPAISLMFPTVIPGIDVNEIDYIDTNFDLWLEELFKPLENESIFSMATGFSYDETEDNLFSQSVETFSTTPHNCEHH